MRYLQVKIQFKFFYNIITFLKVNLIKSHIKMAGKGKGKSASTTKSVSRSSRAGL